MKLHIQKREFGGYSIGACVEYPGIIVAGANDAELVEKFRRALPAHRRALGAFGSKIEVLAVTV